MADFGINVTLDLREVEAYLTKLQRDIVPSAAAAAINRTADTVATEAARSISEATRIPARQVRNRLRVGHATKDHLSAYVEAHGYAPNLARFHPTQNKYGVAASAWEQRKTYRHAFINPRTGRVVTRTTAKRYPLKGLRGPSVRRTFMQERIIKRLEAVARQTWRSRFDHELARRLRGTL